MAVSPFFIYINNRGTHDQIFIRFFLSELRDCILKKSKHSLEAQAFQRGLNPH